jgi:DNA-binding SARP family transcriptional activator
MEGAVKLRFLGTVQVERDGALVGGFRSRKALALLGYLAVQDQPTARRRLADVFWPNQPEARGRANLSWVLSRITSQLPDCLQADRHSVQLDRHAHLWLDTRAFAELKSRGDVASLAAAADLVRGQFLEGLYLQGCVEFELWLVGERERWRQRTASALEALVTHHGRRAEYAAALRFAQRLLEVEPWREKTHRQAMRLLAWDGQRGAALAQYGACCRALADELDVEPAAETTSLYEQIRAGELEPSPATRHTENREICGE